MTFEFCIDSIEGAIAAQQHGAKRVEICAALELGGLTPSMGLIEQCALQSSAEVHVMIRHVAGGFVYDLNDLKVMKNDIRASKTAEACGVVFGCLTPEGELDLPKTKALVEVARQIDLETTFHRAFDTCKDPFQTMEQLIELGVTRILTSGQQKNISNGTDLIRRLVTQANGRIQIMAGGGVNAYNALQLAQTGVDALHFTIHHKDLAQHELGMGTRNSIDQGKITSILSLF
ncbi:MAG: copper homeostasis protein CutC [Flavobacteriales bacterium]|nr:copper homeostasis protein CutC [Flavobacteriales bacterium]